MRRWPIEWRTWHNIIHAERKLVPAYCRAADRIRILSDVAQDSSKVMRNWRPRRSKGEFLPSQIALMSILAN
jgi:hypothetical protein